MADRDQRRAGTPDCFTEKQSLVGIRRKPKSHFSLPISLAYHRFLFRLKKPYTSQIYIQFISPLSLVSHTLHLLQHVEVNRLVKGRPLDNLEFLQWLKRYCDSVNGGIMNENYNPVERRSKGGKERNPKGSQKSTKSLQASNLHNPASGPKHAKAFAVAGGANSSVDIQALLKEITDLKLSVDVLEKERDFYFAKLRDVEILCQTPEFEDFPMTVAVKKILYAADAKESALAEAQQYLAQSLNTDEKQNDAE